MNTIISKATEDDVEQLNLLINSAYRGESAKEGWTTEADLIEGIRTDPEALTEILNKPHSQVLKCVDDKKIIGCVHIEQHGSKLYMGMLTVAPKLQNKGIGKIFLKAIEAEARKLKCTSIYMNVISGRDELIAWYERYGYQTTNQRNPFPMSNPRLGIPKKQLEFVVLEKKL